MFEFFECLRIPKGESLESLRSKCRNGKMIQFYDNIPILSWILLRGKANDLLYCFLFCSILIVIAYIDFNTMEIYNTLSIGGIFFMLHISPEFM